MLRELDLISNIPESPYRLDQEIPAEWSYPESKQEQLRYRVYRDLWNQGFFLSNGSKFGGDFLVYPGNGIIGSKGWFSFSILVWLDPHTGLSLLISDNLIQLFAIS